MLRVYSSEYLFIKIIPRDNIIVLVNVSTAGMVGVAFETLLGVWYLFLFLFCLANCLVGAFNMHSIDQVCRFSIIKVITSKKLTGCCFEWLFQQVH